MNLVLLALGFVLLISGSTFLVDGASSLAKRYHVPSIVVGLTIVAFGTSSPELFVNVVAAIQNRPEIVFGNIVGSNIFNILAICGIAAIVFPLTVKTNTTWIEIPLSLLSAGLLFLIANDQMIDSAEVSIISRIDGFVLILFFVVFMSYNAHLLKAGSTDEAVEIKDRQTGVSVAFILGGLVLLVAGGEIIVRKATDIAVSLGVQERIIGLTIVAMGTSLPELATSVTAVVKRNVDIAIGNVVGSNIFNTFLILGVSTVIRPAAVPVGANLDLMVNIGAGAALFLFVFTGRGRKIERWEGAVLLSSFLAYIAVLLVGT